ncbi:ASCH domain-containing protein [Cellulophaga sp. Ld12]|uniref:ASCH domain-containing protein n=1 Tax=Cellulophaga sp. Ld12 TaxID=3229535 RepID=UPI00386696DF
MRLTSIFLFLTLICCKSETKNDPDTKNAVESMWTNFKKEHPEVQEEQPESYFFHDNKEDANRLAKLILDGKKKAGSGLYLWYEEAKAPLPEVGTKIIVTNFEGIPQAIIETTKVDTIPFNKVSSNYAQMDMGTEIDALNKWKKAHWDFFANAMEESGEQPTETMLIVCERFKTIWPEKK